MKRLGRVALSLIFFLTFFVNRAGAAIGDPGSSSDPLGAYVRLALGEGAEPYPADDDAISGARDYLREHPIPAAREDLIQLLIEAAQSVDPKNHDRALEAVALLARSVKKAFDESIESSDSFDRPTVFHHTAVRDESALLAMLDPNRALMLLAEYANEHDTPLSLFVPDDLPYLFLASPLLDLRSIAFLVKYYEGKIREFYGSPGEPKDLGAPPVHEIVEEGTFRVVPREFGNLQPATIDASYLTLDMENFFPTYMPYGDLFRRIFETRLDLERAVGGGAKALFFPYAERLRRVFHFIDSIAQRVLPDRSEFVWVEPKQACVGDVGKPGALPHEDPK